jgi:FlaA1/EpsC-like NDP-sugar epimerase
MERFSLRELFSSSQSTTGALPLAWPTRERFNQVAGVTGTVLTRMRAAGNLMHGLPFVVLVHWVLIALSAYLACSLRFDGDIPAPIVAIYLRTLPWVIVIRSLIFLPFGLYDGLWKYTGVWDLSRIVLAVLTSSVVLYAPLYSPLGPEGFPRSIVIIDSLLLISFLGGVRLIRRMVLTVPRSVSGKRVLIWGAGDAGEMIVREMRRGGGYDPIGFIDDNPLKVGRAIHGITVLGTANDLARIVEATEPEEVLVAIPSGRAAAVRGILQRLEPFKLKITTLPDVKDLVDGKVAVQQIRPLAIEDLLPRSPVALRVSDVQALVKGKRVLVTGAGGSIGSELCRQITKLAPASLILYERYENSLYAVTNDLLEKSPAASICPVIGDVTDVDRVDAVFAHHRPHLVFHAAAHKHVPLMETNPCEAVKNNIGGTRTVAEAADRHGVERFVLISTDKAANPSSIMGATKRVAEMIVQAMSAGSGTRFVAVRFGNVLGSNGSVIPRMVEQIRAGGPVTVTHPDIRRYFMLIPEAVELVLQAAVLARGRETFVLDMGEQMRIVDMARNLIRLSGFVPDEQIPIKFVGLRPGEKLVEELVGEGELLEPSELAKIFRVRWPQTDARLGELVKAAESHAKHGRESETIAHLLAIVPTFSRSLSMHGEGGGRPQTALGAGSSTPHSSVHGPATGAAVRSPVTSLPKAHRSTDEPPAYR